VTRFRIMRVFEMPPHLEEGVLYVSNEYATAAHLCACGCRSKIRTPLGPAEWRVAEGRRGPTLRPSIGNWQRPCKSHYWIIDGVVEWSTKWSTERIETGRKFEQLRREAYYRDLYPVSRVGRAWQWLKRLMRR
jgi:hypothetical protein